MALEVFDSSIFGQLPLIKMAVRGDDEVKLRGFNCRLNNVQDVQDPFGFVRIPLRRLDFRFEATFRIDVILPGQRLPILFDLVALGVLFGPVDLGRVRRLIAMRGNVTSDTRINVLDPSTSLKLELDCCSIKVLCSVYAQRRCSYRR